MTKKELLLVDLSSRLPHGVIVKHANPIVDLEGKETGEFFYRWGYLYDVCRMDDMTTTIIESEGSEDEGYKHICCLERSVPYLRPMSSMTEEEKEELYSIGGKYKCVDWVEGNEIQFAYLDLSYDLLLEIIDWLNAHHFDYRGLIPKGLAIEVTEENNPYRD